jgi:hypothetical protein
MAGCTKSFWEYISRVVTSDAIESLNDSTAIGFSTHFELRTVRVNEVRRVVIIFR